MNSLESFIYNAVRKNPALKKATRNIYQNVFDLLPQKKEYYRKELHFRENFFFGFHDVCPFSSDETKLLANHNTFDLRMPQTTEGLQVGYFDFQGGQLGEFHQIDFSYAWNYHKGCRLQWLDDKRIIFNTAIKNKLASKVIDLCTQEEEIINYPIDTVHSSVNGSYATSFSYERLERCMPGYGYYYHDGGFLEKAAPVDTGLFLVDLKQNTRKLLVSLADLSNTVAKPFQNGYLHFVTHSEFSPDGKYISFLYRRISESGDYMKRWTRIIVYDLLKNRTIILPTQESGSHYVWNKKNQLLASCIINGKSCHVLFDMNNIADYRIVAGNILNSDGHQSFISDTSFVTDTYPDKYRMAKIYKVDINTEKTELLVNVYSPKQFQTKDFRCHIACDLHPRISPAGKYVCFDSPRTGKRAIYIMNL